MLNTKSEEISRLESLLLAEQEKNRLAEERIKALDEQQKQTTVQAEATTAPADLAELREQWAQEKAAWEAERLTLTTSLNAAVQSKASAEQDRDFFGDQYRQASSQVPALRQENTELEERAVLAEGQVKNGLTMIRATYEKRLERLEDDMNRWRNMAEFLRDKDIRTNDEVRRRAGEEPELRRRCEKLEDDLERLEEEFAEKEEERATFEQEALRWKDETQRLEGELREAKVELERKRKTRLIMPVGDGDPDDLVYRCLWRPEGENQACENVFMNVEVYFSSLFQGSL